MGIFAGLKVADLTWMAAGPIITRELANHGATVVHVETMTRVDTMRWLPPHQDHGFTTETGLPAANVNQSSSDSPVISRFPSECRRPDDRMGRRRELSSRDGRSPWFRVGTGARRNPRAVMLSTSMRGQTGPEATLTGFGLQGGTRRIRRHHRMG